MRSSRATCEAVHARQSDIENHDFRPEFVDDGERAACRRASCALRGRASRATSTRLPPRRRYRRPEACGARAPCRRSHRSNSWVPRVPHQARSVRRRFFEISSTDFSIRVFGGVKAGCGRWAGSIGVGFAAGRDDRDIPHASARRKTGAQGLHPPSSAIVILQAARRGRPHARRTMFDLFDDIPKPDIDWQPDWLDAGHRIRPDGAR